MLDLGFKACNLDNEILDLIYVNPERRLILLTPECDKRVNLFKKLNVMKICIINGPNLNLLGKREPGVYGSASFETYFKQLSDRYKDIELTYFQSNIEGEIIDRLHESGFTFDGIILNAGGYTHTSVAIGDAVKAIKTPVVEVHISNIHAREDFRSITMISAGMKGIITGFGLDSYRLAIESFL
jgi:3-dehydroquinate dehydratase-2